MGEGGNVGKGQWGRGHEGKGQWEGGHVGKGHVGKGQFLTFAMGECADVVDLSPEAPDGVGVGVPYEVTVVASVLYVHEAAAALVQ